VTNTLVISSNATLQINSTGSVGLSNATLVNRGTVEWTGGAIVGSPGTLITNGSGALWLLETDSYLQLNAPVSLTNGLFVNNGTVRKTTTSGTTYFESGNFINKGLVDAESGVISFYSGGVLSGGYNAAPGASIEFGGGAFTLGAFPAITGTGTVALTGGTLTLVTNAPPQLLLEGGSVTLGTNFQNAAPSPI